MVYPHNTPDKLMLLLIKYQYIYDNNLFYEFVK